MSLNFPHANKLRASKNLTDQQLEFKCKRYVESQLREILNTPGYLDDVNDFFIKATDEFHIGILYGCLEEILSNKGYNLTIKNDKVRVSW